MANPEDPDDIRNHSSYKKASRKAGEYKNNPEALRDLVSEADEKSRGAMPKSFEQIRESV